MSIRDSLKANVTTAIGSTNFKVSSELPWNSGDQPLNEKNKRVVYFSAEDVTKTQLYRTLDQGDVYSTETVVTAIFSVDAKNLPTDTQTVLDALLAAVDVVDSPQSAEVISEQEIEDDIITYSVEYNFVTI